MLLSSTGFNFQYWLEIVGNRESKMTALPTSLRRTLLVLLGFMVTIIIMVFYWNQNATRMPSALSNTFLLPVDRHKFMFVLYWIHHFCCIAVGEWYGNYFYFRSFTVLQKNRGRINVWAINAFVSITRLTRNVYHLWVAPWCAAV